MNSSLHAQTPSSSCSVQSEVQKLLAGVMPQVAVRAEVVITGSALSPGRKVAP